LSDHHQKQGVACDVEWNSKKDIRTALIELAAEPAVLDVELEQGVTRRKGDLVGFFRVPTCDEVSPTPRVILKAVEEPLDLVDSVPSVGPVSLNGCSKVAPLVAINRTKVPGLSSEAPTFLCGSPLIPDAYACLLQRLDSGLACEEPQELMNNGAKVEFLCCEKWKTLG